MNRRPQKLFALPILLVFFGCQSQPDEAGMLLFVDRQLVACEGVAPRSCMRVRKDAAAEWEFFYNDIEGFAHRSGCEYTLRVAVTEVENPPADGSSLHYSLIEELARSCSP